MRVLSAIGTLLIGVVIGGLGTGDLMAQAPFYETKQLYKANLENIPGQEVLFYSSTWGPGFRLPWHVHPEGHEFVFVIEGEQTFDIEGVGTRVVKAGEILHTPPNVAHFGRNAPQANSKTLVVRIKEIGKPVMVEVKR